MALTLGFVGAALPLGYLALRDGAYDVVLRQEAFVLIWWGVALACAFGKLPRVSPAAGWRLALTGLIASLAVGVAALSWTASDERTIEEVARLLGYGGVVALAWTALGPATWRAAAAGLFVATGAICIIALASRLTPNLLPLDPIERGLESQRLFQPLGYWNALATFASATMAMGLAWSADGGRTAVRAAALAVTPIAGVCLYLTYSRGGIVELIVGLAAVLYLCQHRRRAATHLAATSIASLVAILVVRSQPQIATGSGYAGAVLVGIVTLLMVSAAWAVARSTRSLGRRRHGEDTPFSRVAAGGPRLARVSAVTLVAVLIVGAALIGRDGFGAGGDAAAIRPSDDPAARLTTAAGNRSAYWSEALRAFADEPLRGSGPGTFRYGWAQYGSEPDRVVDAHSLPLETLAEQGLVGALALATAFFGLLVVAGQGLRAARGNPAGTAMASTVVIYLVAVAIDWMWEMTAVTVLGLGAAAVLGAAASTRTSRRQAERSLVRRPGRLALMVLAIAAGAAQVPGVVANESIRDSERFLSAGDLEAAGDAADDAVTAAPWAASPYAARARVALEDGDLGDADDDARAAVAKEPLEPQHLILFAKVARKMGRGVESRQLLERARSLAPTLRLRIR